MDSLECPLCAYAHEPGSCPPLITDDESLFSADLAETVPNTCACGAKFLGAPGSQSCPLCTKESLFQRILWLSALEQRLAIALADCKGQRESILKHVQSKSYTPPKGPHETYRCAACNGWLHLGYVCKEEDVFLCEACAIREGLTAFLPVSRSEYCHHLYPVAMCELCRFAHARQCREAMRNQARRVTREIARVELTKPDDATVEDV